MADNGYGSWENVIREAWNPVAYLGGKWNV